MSASCCATPKKPAVDPRWRRALWIALVVNGLPPISSVGKLSAWRSFSLPTNLEIVP